MEIRHLHYFIAVAEMGHFGKAAERLNMSQSPLSFAIKQLEEDLGAALFTRTTRRVSLTAAGESLLVDARRILEDIDHAKATAARLGRGQTGSVRIGTTGLAALGHLPQIARLSTERLPDVELVIQPDMLAATLAREVADGRLDIALLRPTADIDQVSTALIAVERMVVAVPAESDIARRTSVRLSQLSATPFVTYRSPESAINRTVALAAAERGFTPESGGRADEIGVVLALVSGGLGVAVLPESVRAISVTGVSYVDLADAVTTELRLAWAPATVSPAGRRLIEALLDAGFITSTRLGSARHGRKRT